jgi:gluconolactonase
MSEIREIASGLQFPEGPIAMPDGSVILVEIKRGTLSRVTPNGKIEVIAETGGGPNGAAIGPDGKVYVCNDGGFEWSEINGLTVPGHQPHDYSGGRIERVDLKTGKVEVLYTECDGHPLRGPNDLVFDRSGGFWFTDHGKVRERERDRTGVYYAKPDGSMIREVIFPIDSPNGVGLSPDEKKLYVAETWTGRLWAWDVPAPGQITAGNQPFTPGGGRLLANVGGFQLLDSLAVDSAGNVCVATIINGGITVVSPDGSKVDHVPLPDPLTTNVCFGGPDLRTAFATLSGTGKLVSIPWPRAGLRLNFC